MARRRGRAYKQAQRDALLRYGPEINALLELQDQAVQTFQQARNSARANTRSTVQQINRAAPVLDRAYDAATAANTATAGLVNANAATQSPEIQAALAQEQATALGRIGEQRALSTADLQTRKVSAREGRTFAVGQARQAFAKDIGSVLRRKQQLAAEQGQYVVGQAAGYRQDAAERRAQAQAARRAYKLQLLGLQQSERASIRASGIDPNTGLPIPGGSLDSDANGRPGNQSTGKDSNGDGKPDKARDLRTPAARAEAGDTFDSLVSTATRLHQVANRGAGSTMKDIKAAILRGRPPTDDKPIYKTDGSGKRELNPDGTPKVIPGKAGVKPYTGPEILLDAALEQAILGHITRPTARKLRRRGLRPRQLGDVQRPNPGRGYRPQSVAGPK